MPVVRKNEAVVASTRPHKSVANIHPLSLPGVNIQLLNIRHERLILRDIRDWGRVKLGHGRRVCVCVCVCVPAGLLGFLPLRELRGDGGVPLRRGERLCCVRAFRRGALRQRLQLRELRAAEVDDVHRRDAVARARLARGPLHDAHVGRARARVARVALRGHGLLVQPRQRVRRLDERLAQAGARVRRVARVHGWRKACGSGGAAGRVGVGGAEKLQAGEAEGGGGCGLGTAGVGGSARADGGGNSAGVRFDGVRSIQLEAVGKACRRRERGGGREGGGGSRVSTDGSGRRGGRAAEAKWGSGSWRRGTQRAGGGALGVHCGRSPTDFNSMLIFAPLVANWSSLHVL